MTCALQFTRYRNFQMMASQKTLSCQKTHYSEREKVEINVPEDGEGYCILEAEVEVALKEMENKKACGTVYK